MTEPPLAWERENTPELDEKGTRTGSFTLVPDDKNPTRVRAAGPCPKCGHQTVQSVPLQVLTEVHALPAVLRGLGRKRPKRSVVEVLCDCGREHPRGPDEDPDGTGCGRSWRVTVSW